MPRGRSWTDEQLLEAIAASTSWFGVVRALGLTTGGRTYGVLRRRASDLRADTSHLPGLIDGRPLSSRRFTDDDLRAATLASASYAEVMRRLGYEPSGGIHRFIKGHIKRLNLDTSHFLGQAWARGKKGGTGGSFKARPLVELLVDGSKIGGSALLRRLIREGIKDRRCESCLRTTWLDQPVPLELDHVNGDPTDNRLENLRALCPNCHALTATYCGRNRRPA
jgi:hypothetical protein